MSYNQQKPKFKIHKTEVKEKLINLFELNDINVCVYIYIYICVCVCMCACKKLHTKPFNNKTKQNNSDKKNKTMTATNDGNKN